MIRIPAWLLPPALVVLWAVSAAASPLPSSWTPLGPFGGVVDSLTADPVRPGVLYAATPSGVYKTADAGGTWAAVYLGPLVKGRVAVDPLHPATLYLTGDSRTTPLFKSVDGGAHWASASADLPSYLAALAIDPARPRRLYLGANGAGIFRSVDAGASWKPANGTSLNGLPGGPHGAVIVSLAAALRPLGNVLASTHRGIYRSTDGGGNWKPAAGVPSAFGGAVAFAPSDPRIAYASVQRYGLYRSRDGGASWRRVLEASAAAAGISVSARDPRLVYVQLADHTLFRSTDGGDRWIQLQARMPVTAVAADPFSAPAVYSGLLPATTPGGVWRSGNQGKTWTARSQGLAAISTTSLAVDPRDPERLWTATPFGPYRSANGGARWTRVRMPPGEDGVSQVAAGAGPRIFALTWQYPSPHHERPPYSLWRTDDDGASWTRLPLPSSDVHRFRLAPSRLSTLYAAAVLAPTFESPQELVVGFLRSTDGGAHWESRPRTEMDCGFGDLEVAPSAPTVVYLGGCVNIHAATVLRSGDGGVTFSGIPAQQIGRALRALAVDPRDPDVLWAGMEGSEEGNAVWKSVDGGASWAPTGAELTAPLAITALLASEVPERVYAATGDGRIFRSDDGGASWEKRDAGLTVSSVSELAADPEDPRRIYAVTSNGVWILNEND